MQHVTNAVLLVLVLPLLVCFNLHRVTIEALCGFGRIENEYGIRDLPWIGPALRHLDLSHNAWLATHHAYGLLGANDGSGAAVNPGDAGASSSSHARDMSTLFFIHHQYLSIQLSRKLLTGTI